MPGRVIMGREYKTQYLQLMLVKFLSLKDKNEMLYILKMVERNSYLKRYSKFHPQRQP